MRKWISTPCQDCSGSCKKFLELEGNIVRMTTYDGTTSAPLGDPMRVRLHSEGRTVELRNGRGALMTTVRLSPEAFAWLKAKHEAAMEES